jgi:outer membrane receptor protein involved in Fe transport
MDEARVRSKGLVAGAVALALGCSAFIPRDGRAAEAAPEGDEVQEVTVTGSRIRRDGFEAPNPLTVIGVEQMERLGQVNVAEALSSIPQNSAFQSETNVGIVATANVGSSFANLRGLNPFFGTRTLTLVDSRRFVPTSDGGAVDLNIIPSAMISRVETITGGASAAYGSDAIAGVVNVILDKQFTGIKGQVDYGQTFHGDARSRHASLAAGSDFGGGRGHAMIGLEYQTNDGVDSCASARTWCQPGWDVFSNTGLADADATPQRTTPGGTPNVRNRRYLGQPHYIIAPNSKQAFNVATGVFRDQAMTPVVLRYKKFNEAGTAIQDMDPGRYAQAQAFGPRSGGDGDSTFEDSALRAPLDRYSVFAHGSWDFTDALEGTLEVAWAGREVNVAQQITGPRSTMFIQPDNAYLPPAVAALFPPGSVASIGKDLDSTEFRNVNHSEAQTVRVVAGLSGDLFADWNWDAYYQFGRNDREQSSSRVRTNHFFQYALDAVDEGRFRTGTPNGNIVCRATLLPVVPAAAEGCAPMNLFGLNGLTQEAVDYAYRMAPEDFEYTQHVVAATATGDVFAGIGAGAVSAAVGLEYRSESGDVTHGDIPYYNEFAFSYGQDYGGDIEVLEGFAEVNAPLLRDRPLARNLELSAAVRQTRNEARDKDPDPATGAARAKSVNITSWKISSIWDPVDWLRVRATRSRDIRAAGFRELFHKTVPSEVGTTAGVVTNPWDNGVQDNTPILTGGDFELEPEAADTITAGFVFSPGGWAEGLRLSADWYEIKIEDAITSVSANQLVDYCFDLQIYCNYVTFNPAVPDNTDITFVRATQLNLANFTSRGVDIEAAYALPLERLGDWGRGTLSLRMLASINYKLLFQTRPGDPGVDYAGQTGPGGLGNFNTGPKWQMNSLFTYSLDRFSTTLNIRYIPAGKLNANRIGPDDPRYAGLIAASYSDLTSATPQNTISNNRVESRTYLGLSANYKVPYGDDEGSWELFGSINNLLNADPPIAPGGGGGGGSNYPTNPVYFDTLGAQFRMGLRVHF